MSGFLIGAGGIAFRLLSALNDRLHAFRQLTGCPIIVNTSFNVRGEPIVCTPEDSYRCFMRTEMDYLVLETCVLDKKEQPAFKEDRDWRSQFALD